MKAKLLGFAVALLAVATVGIVQLQAEAVDTTRDCDKYAVVYCGTMTPQEARNKYDQASRIFGAMGISRGEISGNFKHGVVYRDGRVVVNGKTVATGARTAIRNMSGGNKIAGTNAAIYSTSRMGSAQTAMVKFDNNGRFLFAIMKPCGNPVKATPTKPEPKPEAKCVNLSVNKLSDNRFRFTAKADAKHGAKIRGYTFVVKQAGKTVHTKNVNTSRETASYTYNRSAPGTYAVHVIVKTSVGNKSGNHCAAKFTVPKKPSAKCVNLSVAKLSDNRFTFTAKADARNGAKVRGYSFVVRKNGQTVATKNVTTNRETARYTYSQSTPGTYTVNVTVKTSIGNKSGKHCQANFTIPEQPKEDNPGVKVEKLVNGKEHDKVEVGETFTYQLKVTNTGDVALEDVKVTDTPEDANIDLVSAAVGTITGNTWTYTIPSLAVGESMDFALTATVLEYKAGDMVNTVCVDAPEVPGNPDDCDDATVEVPPKPGMVEVCNPETGEIITVSEDEADNYVPVNSPECKEMKVCLIDEKTIVTIKKSEFDSNIHSTDLSDCDEAPVVETPTELPQTGPAEVMMQLAGVISLAGASAYYLGSRRL